MGSLGGTRNASAPSGYSMLSKDGSRKNGLQRMVSKEMRGLSWSTTHLEQADTRYVVEPVNCWSREGASSGTRTRPHEGIIGP
jgi:hypothetical protein